MTEEVKEINFDEHEQEIQQESQISDESQGQNKEQNEQVEQDKQPSEKAQPQPSAQAQSQAQSAVKRLTKKEREEIIANYKNGINSPDYKVSIDVNGNYRVVRINKNKKDKEKSTRASPSATSNNYLNMFIEQQKQIDNLTHKYKNLKRKHRKLKRNIYADAFEGRVEDEENDADAGDVETEQMEQERNEMIEAVEQEKEPVGKTINLNEERELRKSYFNRFMKPQASWRQRIYDNYNRY